MIHAKAAMPTPAAHMMPTAVSKTRHQPQPSNTTSHNHARAISSILSPDRDEMLCRYPSKLCDNIRSEKRGGGLHRFCLPHRERANINQRRVDHRRRLRRQGITVPLHERWQKNERSAASEGDEGTEDFLSLDVDLFDISEDAALFLPDFSEDDLQQLMCVLNDTESISTVNLDTKHIDTAAVSFSNTVA